MVAVINSFLVTLVNEATAPVNPSSTTGVLYWPPVVRVKTYTGLEQAWHQFLFDGTTGVNRLVRAIEYLWLVEASLYYDVITSDDTRITYDSRQLLGQLVNTTPFSIVPKLERLYTMPQPTFLSTEQQAQFGGALSNADRLATIVSHFGKR